MSTPQEPLESLQKFIPKASRAPKVSNSGVVEWLRAKVFNNVWNSLLSLTIVYLFYILVTPMINWGIVDAVWVASNRRECIAINSEGACWAGVISWFNNLIYGRYPDFEQWRINLAFGMIFIWIFPIFLQKTFNKKAIVLPLFLLFPFLGSYLFLGGNIGEERSVAHGILSCAALALIILNYCNLVLAYVGRKSLGTYVAPYFQKMKIRHAPQYGFCSLWVLTTLVIAYSLQTTSFEYVPVEKWGGLFLTLIIAGFSITMALPLGMLFALGRRSKMPVIKWMSIGIIEIVRSVPLITVLFMAVTILPFFIPANMELNLLVQVLVAVCIFSGAYMAETIRGGLQAIPKGQYEAAKSIGFGYWQTMGLIVLPQALRLMIPNIVTSFISLLKDTTLVSIIGLFDLMLMARNISIDKDWLGLHTEPLVFISLLFFVLCYGMSHYSLWLEQKLKVSR